MSATAHNEVAGILETYGLTPEQSKPIVTALSKTPTAWADFMMRFEPGLEEPNPNLAFSSVHFEKENAGDADLTDSLRVLFLVCPVENPCAEFQIFCGTAKAFSK
jgi:hypothetical protein